MIFQKIIDREIKADIVFENEYVIAFKDINPKAKVHLLVIPKIEIANVDGINSENSKYIEEIFKAIPVIAKENGLEKGYRVLTNNGANALQEIYWIHFHILGGERLGDIC